VGDVRPADGRTAEPPILLDVTLRDGGYVNGHSWTTGEAISVVRTMEAAQIPFVEVGYLREPSGESLNPSMRCEPPYLLALAAEVERTRLVVMVRPAETPKKLIAGLRGQGVGMVRVLAAALDVGSAASYVEAAQAEGLSAAVNLTHASRFGPDEIAAAAAQAARAGAEFVYLADSNGSLFPEEVTARVAAAAEEVRAAGAPDGSVAIGFHAHDNLGLAFANTCAALRAGVGAVDASLGGIGKGGGNLRLELIAGHLAFHGAAGYLLDPLVSDRTTSAAKLKMLADGPSNALVTGLLDVSLDQYRQFQEQAARHGYDQLLRYGLEMHDPVNESFGNSITPRARTRKE
jgi:4-hydroxy 2-oxovalerate aldolase